ncbi:hypothetical protein JTE90_019667 [Oedothorax gibbosus]|uniref:Uncharacterized protein n=1 Tax=Oedothorax gibbosus TaxID=931172 RepID=A0AAV6UZK8_9ARAC|nr:hypothetical protein JTE90_019667 [Oedothorax gibbosus]
MFEASAESFISKNKRRVFVLDDEGTYKETARDLDSKGTDTNKSIYSTEADYNRPSQVKKRKKIKVSSRITKSMQSSHQSTIKDLFSSFLKKSSIYAVNQVGNSNTTRRKVFWSFILIGGLIGCCSQVYRYLKVYYKYPVVISLDTTSLFNQEFPGVTICNLNKVKKSYFSCFMEKLEVGDCNKTTNLTFKVERLNPSGICLSKSGDGVEPDLDYEYLERIHYLSLYLSLKYASKIRYGHQAKDFIRFCSFNGVECSHKDFAVFADDTFGNCFSFNKVNFSEEPLRSSFVGPNSGLNLELDVQSDEYVWLSQSVGARVVIHDPYHEPETQVEGINVSPGFETSIGVSKVLNKRLEYPYKDQCRKYSRGDSKRKCERLCHQDKVSNICGCSFKPTTAYERQCDLTNTTELCCLYRGEEDLEEEENVTCDCPLECHSSNVELKISSGVWPASLESFGDFNVSLEAIRETRVRLKIYFETLEQIVYEQKPMFEDSEVLSQIGGQMGLWLGLSLAAVFECLENIVLFCRYRKK